MDRKRRPRQIRLGPLYPRRPQDRQLDPRWAPPRGRHRTLTQDLNQCRGYVRGRATISIWIARRSCPGGWCARADAIFDVPDMHGVDVEIDDQQRLVLTVESGQLEAGCPACGGCSRSATAAGSGS